MASGNMQPKWDIYEAVILLDGYLEMHQTKTPKKRMVKIISDKLRNMAVNRGITIDDVYRNENGISYQIQSMDSAYKGYKVYVPATKLFVEAVDIYRKNPEKYIKLFNEAKRMITKNNDLTVLKKTANTSNIVDFMNIGSMAFTRPVRMSYCNEELSAPSSWKDVYINIVSILYKSHSDVFEHLRSFPESERLEFGTSDESTQMTAPRKIDDHFCIETNFSATDLVKRIKTFLSMCDVDYENVIIQYERKEDSNTHPNTTSVKMSNYSEYESAFYAYLHDTAKLADRTCCSYISSIKSAERYAANCDFEFCTLIGENREITLATATALYSDPQFVKNNEKQHNRFSAAINKLMEYIGEDIPEKALVQIDDVNVNQQSDMTEDYSGIKEIIMQYYQYGVKYDSIRELMRFRQYAESMRVHVPSDDEQLKTAILSCGTVIDDKVYCKSDELQQELQSIIDEIFSSGHEVVYYECLLENKSEWMSSHVITSEDMIKEYLRKNISGCSFAKKFMMKGNRLSEKEAVTAEIERVWGNRQAETVYSLSERLPYIPLNNIWRVISGNDHFVLVSEGEYLFIERFQISEDEERDILEFVDSACNENGFASLSDVPLGDIAEENYEVPKIAIYNAIYKTVLSSKYHLNGKIITRDKTELDAVALLKQYLNDRDECTFDEIEEKIVNLTGDMNRQYAFQALYDEMIRIDKNRFVANRFVHFNIDEIDSVLSGFITDSFLSIRDITTFAMFPLCGQTWNHYLLESYCYKFSKKYSLHVINFNDKNTGIIAEMDYNKKYNEMLAIAVARTDIDLIPETIGKYLFSTGYLAKSKYAKLNEITQLAEKLRKER